MGLQEIRNSIVAKKLIIRVLCILARTTFKESIVLKSTDKKNSNCTTKQDIM